MIKKLKNRNLRIAVEILAVLVVLIIVGFIIMKPEPILLQGEVEATQIKVAGKIVGRINTIYVKEGQKVKAGDVLLDISSPEIEAKMQQAVAAKNAALAQSNKAKKGTRSEQIQTAYMMWQKAKTGSELAKLTFDRVSNLFKEGVIAAQKRDEAESQMKAALMTEDAAKSQYDMATKGAEDEDKDAALAMLDKALGAINEVESYKHELIFTAPINAEVANVNAEKGELITAGFPVVNLVDLNDIWITFNVREDYLTKISMGKVIVAKFPALGNKEVKLKINYINSLGGFATWRATKTRGDFDIRTFEVRAVPIENVAGLRPGMTALLDWSHLK